MKTKQMRMDSRMNYSKVEMRGDDVYIDGVKIDDIIQSNIDRSTSLDEVRSDYLSSLDRAGDLTVSQHYNSINAQCASQCEEYFKLTRANRYEEIDDDLPTWDEINGREERLF